jgi:aldehyde oxidoreductase
MSVTESHSNESTASTIGFRVNGTPVTVRGTHEHLLSALRDELDITSPKDGCSPSGCSVGSARQAL